MLLLTYGTKETWKKRSVKDKRDYKLEIYGNQKFQDIFLENDKE